MQFKNRIIRLFVSGSCITMALSFFLYGCNKEDNDSADPVVIETVNNVLTIQEEAYEMLTQLLNTTDTSAAKDSVLNLLLRDPIVQNAGTNTQGIYIQYENGIRGGIIIDFEDDPTDTVSPFEIDQAAHYKSGIRPDAVPAEERNAILNPHYYEREWYTQKILSTYDNRLPIGGFYEPEAHFNDDCSLEKFTFLENYGIIHIYSHGWAWPSSRNIIDVYLMTGENVNERTTNLYWKYIASGDIPLVILDDETQKYFISPEFICDFNNFSDDSTLIYGGFCYSYLGNWPELIINAGALGYFGFNWSVMTKYNAKWARALVTDLTNTDRLIPMTVTDWFNDSRVKKSYSCNKAPGNAVKIMYYGHPDAALLRKKIQVDLTKINEVQCDLMADIEWNCAKSNLTVQPIFTPVELTTRSYSNNWDMIVTYTGSILVNEKWELNLCFNEACTEIESFYIKKSWNYMADDEELQKYGYPITKTQIFSGHDLPLWVNEPEFDRFIYGVQGSDAINYLSTLSCECEFPDGTSCSIDKYQFTDDVLQMIRFDFHIR